MSARREHPSELEWVRYLAGEAGWFALLKMRRHLERCPACAGHEARRRTEQDTFRSDPRVRVEAARLAANAGARARVAVRPGATSWRWLVAGTAAVGVLAALPWMRTRPPEVLLPKGADTFVVHVERPSGVAVLGDRCAEGDRLMASFRTRRPYLLVLERDGRGTYQVLYPPGRDRSGPAPAGGTTPTSWILDGAPGRECFLAVYSDSPVAASEVQQAWLASPLPAVSGATVRTQCCDKAAAP